MAGILGAEAEAFKFGYTSAFISEEVEELTEQIYSPVYYFLKDSFLSCFYSSYRISKSNRWGIQASEMQNYFNDYYFRIHVTPSLLELGNLLSSQVREIEVWNAYLVPKTLNSITATSSEGLTLNGTAPPTTYNVLEARTYSLNIDIVGSPIIDNSYVFNFPEDSPVVYVTGRRVVLWSFIPQTSHREILEWKTDLIPSFNSEQRLALRHEPRQAFNYECHLNEQQFSRAKALNTEWAHRVYGIPVWSEATYVGELTAGATSVFLDTAYADYRENDIFLIWESDTRFEAIENLQVLNDRLNLKLPLPNNYNKAYIIPLRFARTLQGIEYLRRSDPYVIARGTFFVTSNADLGASVGYDIYRNKDVIPDRTIIVSDLRERISRQIDTFDNGSGPVEIEIQNNWVNSTKMISFDTMTREERWAARQWIHSRRGKQKGFWLPSWNSDLISVADVTASATALTCLPIGFPLYYGIKDIMIQLTDGRKLYNRVLHSQTSEDGNEVLSLENNIGVDLPVGVIDFICFMSHVRLNSDRIEIQHSYAGRTTISIPIIETPE